MWRRIIRQRRRLALCLVLGAATGALLSHGGTGGTLPWRLSGGLPVAPDRMLPGALAGGLGMAGLAAAIVVAAPAWRWFVLKLAVVAVLAALAWRLAGTPPQATLAAAVAAVLLLPAQPAFLDRWRVPFLTRARVDRRLPVPPDWLWETLRPRPTDWHWDPQVRAVRGGAQPDVLVYVHEPLGGGEAAEMPARVFDLEPGHFKLRDLTLPAADRGGPVTVTSHTVEADGAEARLVVMEASWRQGLGTALALWLDDYLADHVDRMAALLEDRRDWSMRGAMLRAARRAAAQRPGRRKPTRR